MLNKLKGHIKKKSSKKILNTWNNQFDIPIFNYYESFNDLRRMLKNYSEEELNIADFDFLTNKLMELQDWFAKQMDENTYNSTYKSISRLIKYKYKRHSLTTLLIGLKMYNIDTKTEWLMDSETIEALKSTLNNLNLHYRIKITDQVKDIETAIKGLNNDIGMLEKKLTNNKSAGEHNYMETVFHVNKVSGYRINPYEYTLYEWVNTLKVINKMPKPKK